MGNAVFTFEQLLAPHLQAEAPKTAAAIEKVKLRVLKVKVWVGKQNKKISVGGAPGRWGPPPQTPPTHGFMPTPFLSSPGSPGASRMVHICSPCAI